MPAASLALLLSRRGPAGGLGPGPAPLRLGLPALDRLLGGGLARAALHELQAAREADRAAAAGFAAALARIAAGERPVLWVRQDALEGEAGRLHAPGLAALGLEPANLVLVRARDLKGLMRAGADAARCAALGAVLIEPWGTARALDLTASRRLAHAARESGVPTLLLRLAGAAAPPSAAATRWLVRPLPSRPLAAAAPGHPAFRVTLLRHRGGRAEGDWRLEWDREGGRFAERAARARGPAEGPSEGSSAPPLAAGAAFSP